MTGDRVIVRLPGTIRPKHYDLNLSPNFQKDNFEGEVQITIEVVEETHKIVLNSLNLIIVDVVLKYNHATFIPKSIKILSVNEILELVFNDFLSIGEYILNITFVGGITKNLRGFFKMKYVNNEGKSDYLFATGFQPIYARLCFPCWDEPCFKASFDINVTVPSSFLVLSNMPWKHVLKTGGNVRYCFETTPKMPTYAVGIVVCDYQYVEKTSKNGVRVRIYCAKEKLHLCSFALDSAVKITEFYKEYLRMNFPLPKLDLVTLPNFWLGGSEHWGILMCNELSLLRRSDDLDETHEVMVLDLAHAIAHQYFGCLLTVKWWSSIWLSESFATFMQYVSIDNIFPELNIWHHYAAEVYMKSMQLDSNLNSPPMEMSVTRYSDLYNMKNKIVYFKGAAIIRLLSRYLGEDDFRKGLYSYLLEYKYKNVVAKNLWDTLEEVSKKPIAIIMSTWTNQAGYPFVTINLRKEGNSDYIYLRQDRFVLSGTPTDDCLWMIPLEVSSSNRPGKEILWFLLKSKEQKLHIPNMESAEYIYINPEAVGYYRTLYSTNMLLNIKPAIINRTLPTTDRLAILNDLFAFVRVGQVTIVEMLEFVKAFVNEESFPIWYILICMLHELKVLVADTDIEENFRKYQLAIFINACLKMGWDPEPNEDYFTRRLRAYILSCMVHLNYEPTIEQGVERFGLHFGEGPKLPNELLFPAMISAIKGGFPGTFDIITNLYRTAQKRIDRVAVYKSLCASTDPAFLRKTMEFALSDDVSREDCINIIGYVAGESSIGTSLAWNFYTDNWQIIEEKVRYAHLINNLGSFFEKGFISEEVATDIEAFFKTNKDLNPDMYRRLHNSISIKRSWVARDMAHIKAYFKSH